MSFKKLECHLGGQQCPFGFWKKQKCLFPIIFPKQLFLYNIHNFLELIISSMFGTGSYFRKLNNIRMLTFTNRRPSRFSFSSSHAHVICALETYFCKSPNNLSKSM